MNETEVGGPVDRDVGRLLEELERERMRLAACGVVAMADTPESAAKWQKERRARKYLRSGVMTMGPNAALCGPSQE